MCDNVATHVVIHFGQRASYACAEHAEQMRETAEDVAIEIKPGQVCSFKTPTDFYLVAHSPSIPVSVEVVLEKLRELVKRCGGSQAEAARKLGQPRAVLSMALSRSRPVGAALASALGFRPVTVYYQDSPQPQDETA